MKASNRSIAMVCRSRCVAGIDKDWEDRDIRWKEQCGI